MTLETRPACAGLLLARNLHLTGRVVAGVAPRREDRAHYLGHNLAELILATAADKDPLGFPKRLSKFGAREIGLASALKSP